MYRQKVPLGFVSGPAERDLALPKRLAEKFWALAPGLFWEAIGVRTCCIDKTNFGQIPGLYLPLIQTRVANQSCYNRG